MMDEEKRHEELQRTAVDVDDGNVCRSWIEAVLTIMVEK
jgi:hypothetical protein